MPPLRLSAIAVAFSLAACGADDAIRRMTPPGADARAREYIALFTSNRVDSAIARLHPQLAGANSEVQLNKIGALLTGERFDSTRAIGADVNTINGIRHTNLTYELHGRSGWLLANVATVDSSGTWFVEGVSARPIPRTLEEENRFSIAGKSLLHFAWIALLIASVVTALGAAVFLATRRAMPKRWRWVLASLVGVGSYSLNWTTGAVGVGLVSLQLGAGSALRSSPAAPWILSFGIPVGAMAGLLRYRRWRRMAAAPVDAQTAVPQAAV